MCWCRGHGLRGVAVAVQLHPAVEAGQEGAVRMGSLLHGLYADHQAIQSRFQRLDGQEHGSLDSGSINGRNPLPSMSCNTWAASASSGGIGQMVPL